MSEATDSEKEIRESCLRLLTRREHSQRELLDKLSVKGHDRSNTQRVIDKLINDNWQSDERFAESYTRFRVKKGFGPVKISYELRQKGIVGFDLGPVIIDLADSWLDLMKQVYQKKFTDNNLLSQKEKLKRFRFLQQRGFSNEMISSLFKD